MSDLTFTEKRKFEQLLKMGSGYVLDFSNRSFAEFVLDTRAPEQRAKAKWKFVDEAHRPIDSPAH